MMHNSPLLPYLHPSAYPSASHARHLGHLAFLCSLEPGDTTGLDLHSGSVLLEQDSTETTENQERIVNPTSTLQALPVQRHGVVTVGMRKVRAAEAHGVCVGHRGKE
jgi:ribulose-5-phosphate 4-epimerase/fuculose-1-phosphate aldolase